MPVLEVQGLCKTYPKFRLENVSFSLEKGRIMGLIGRNGAGKTTTLKSLLNLVHPDCGERTFFGMDLEQHEQEIKCQIGYAGGAVDYYHKKKIRLLADVTKQFYPNWDEAAYRKYLNVFSLDEEKTPDELSEGMRVKLSLTLALSHRAELLILDEPTSGLDPVSRAELLDVFTILRSQGTAILFSTHITTDLEACADDVTYLAAGKMIASEPMEAFLKRGPSLQDIMVQYEKEDLREKLAE